MISDTMTPEELAEYDEYILSMGPRFYGPDVDDEGANVMVFFTGIKNETI